ncbi:hypothetical protein GGX14DRAFT_692982 [Mycena pura]|uniref:Uncharacterized protein n=1 Tax=Mycena pura TaxID=153505 RepID=A0AAD6YQN2_9AGAR|nr:hypothetical protein GGX14DRAFT_692982 [Mycena pura]
MNVDMEAAQIPGAASSIINTNQPRFSGITTVDPTVFATYFIKLCAMCGMNDFKGILPLEDFRHIQDFHYIQTVDELNNFTQWIYSLGIEEITSFARLNDLSVVRKLDISTSTGVLPNANNSEYRRLSRGIGRQAAAAQRARDAREQIETTADLKSLIAAEAAEQALRKESIATEKKFQAELKGTKGAKKRSKCAVAAAAV